MFHSKKNWRHIIRIVFIILIIAAIAKLALPLFSTEEFRALVEKAGIWGPAVFILYWIIAQVIAPLSGSLVLLVSAAIYGVVRTVVFYYLAFLVSSVINFSISRKLGRPWIKKLGGKKILKDVDKIVDKLGTKTLIFSRIIGFPVSDFISYAAGFTKLSFKRYFLITAIFAPVPLIGFVLVFRNMEVSGIMILYYIGMVAVLGGTFALVMRRALRE